MAANTDTTLELTAGEVMTRKFVAVAPEDTLGEVAEKLSLSAHTVRTHVKNAMRKGRPASAPSRPGSIAC